MSDTNSPNESYEEILREHEKLHGLLDALRRLFAERTGPFGEVAARLSEFQELVESHFRTEEDSGCFGDLVNHAPRVSDKVETLIAEHNELSVDLSGLVELASGAQGSAEDWEEANTRFESFTARLMQHETVENELMQEVFTEDIGSKD